MSIAPTRARGTVGPLARPSGKVPHLVLRLLGLAVVDAFAVSFVYVLVRDGAWPLAAMTAIVTAGVNAINLREDLYPLRWLSPGLALLILMALYPVLYTVYTAFTNYGDGHLLTKQQAVRLLTREQYLPQGASTYRWTAFHAADGRFVLWLVPEAGPALLARPGEPVQEAAPGVAGIGALDADGVPESMEGYTRLSRSETVRYLSELDGLEFGKAPRTVRIRSLDEAGQLQQRYVYDGTQDAIADAATGTVYRADDKQGVFASAEGETLATGYQVPTGLSNFRRLLRSPALRGPFVQVFIWTFAFALLSAVSTFALGLFLALVLDDPMVPGRKLIRSLLIIPYSIPGVIGILIWRGMLSPHLGVIGASMEGLIGWSPPWFSHPGWAKVAVLLINLWLGYPYMMLVCSGALQAIPVDLNDAAEVDGAGLWQRFGHITLPLLLVSVGPLLLASFTFHFNNFNVIYLFNEGGPPIAGTLTPAGHTDILISYTYRLAFAGERGADYGYAAAITMVIFALLSIITALYFRCTRAWEEVWQHA